MSTLPRTSLANSSPHRSASILALLLIGLAVSGLFTGRASGATQPLQSCSANALAFCETLEPVIEAVTDGRPNKVPAASAKAQLWWAENRARFAESATIDSAMKELRALATSHRAPLAARAAVKASISALDACTEPPTDSERLMRIDLAGMAGWLRAHGVDAPFPSDTDKAAQAIGKSLRARGRATLAEQLRKDVAATLAIPVRVNGTVNVANALLQRVDDAEQAVR